MGVGIRVEELADRADDETLLFIDQLGIDRQREGLASGGFGIGKITRLVAQRRESRVADGVESDSRSQCRSVAR